MSVAPSSDLVLEVSRAADPARAAAVVDKLKALSSSGAASPADFANALDAAESGGAAAASSLPVKQKGAAPDSHKAQTKLESVLLSQFVGEMLPKDTPSAFGSGYAGDMWRSMLAERVADQMAASGRLGIAARLFANHPLSNSQKTLAPQGADHTHVSQVSANALSVSQSADVHDGAVLFAKSAPL